MRKYFRILLGGCIVFVRPAAADQLKEYDERIRHEAKLPSEWFRCKKEKDCDLVSVPCQSDIAVTASHKDDAQEALIKQYPFCLGGSQHNTEAKCKKHECVTEGAKRAD